MYFTLDETDTEDAIRDNTVFHHGKESQFFFGDADLSEELKERESNSTTPPATPLKRNSNRRTSLYAKFISARRNTTKGLPSNASSNTVSSVKQRFKFRSSSKVPKLNENGQPVNGNIANGTLHSTPLSQSHYQTSEPSLHRVQPAPRISKMSNISVSSMNLTTSVSAAKPPVVPFRPIPQPRRRSYKSADMSLMLAPFSLLAAPLTTNSGWICCLLFLDFTVCFLFFYLSHFVLFIFT